MKKMMMLMLTAALLLTCAGAYAENTTEALKAFSALSGTNVTLDTAARTIDEYLDKVMAGDYLAAPVDDAAAYRLALELSGLSSVTTKDIAVYAAARQLPAAQVRNAYFRSLANVLRAEIQINPASEEEYKNIQVILSLFLDESNDNVTRTSREAIRKTITTDHAKKIASTYKLPQSFVEFIVMDDNWDDDSWENDNSWQAGSDWNTDDLYDDSLEDYIDTDGVAGNSIDSIDGNSVDNSVDGNSVDGNSVDNSADGNSVDAASVDYASPESVDYASPASVDYASPASVDYASPASVDYSSPDYASPASVDYSSPEYNTPEYNTPEYNSPASVDYSSPASVDYGGSGSYDS